MDQRQPAPNLPVPLLGSLRAQLSISFCLLFALLLILVKTATILGIPHTGIEGRLGQERQAALLGLSQEADLKKSRLLSWLNQRRADVRSSAVNQLVARDTRLLASWVAAQGAQGREGQELWREASGQEAYRQLLEYFNQVMDIYGQYRKVDLIAADTGRVFFSTDPHDLGRTEAGREAFDEAVRSRGMHVSDIHRGEDGGPNEMDFSHVVLGEDGKILAVLNMTVDPEDIIKPLLNVGEGGLGRSDSVLVNSETRVLTSLRHPLADGSRAEPLVYQIQALPAKLAAGGQEGIVAADDYRQVPVLAAYRHVRLSSSVGWGLVVKRDLEEVFAPLRADVAQTVIISLVGLFLAGGLIVALARFLTRPIVDLSRTARRVQAGDLDARAPVSSRDEVGQLAQDFNSMVDVLQELNLGLEARVDQRTQELEAATRELRLEIGQRRRVEEALRESEQQYRLHFEHSLDGLLLSGENGQVLAANPEACRLLGYTQGEIVGLGRNRLLDSSDPKVVDGLRERESNGWFRGDLTFFRKDGSRLEVEVASSFFEDSQGRRRGNTIFRDIGERKQAERERALLEAQLRQAQKMEAIGTLAGGIAHDFNNILGAIMGFTELATELAKEGEPHLDELDQVVLAAERARNLVRQILTFGRKAEGDPRPMDLNQAVRQTTVILERTLPKMIGIETRLTPDLSPILADPGQVEQVLLNLASNAADAMPQGGRLLIETQEADLDQEYCRSHLEVAPGAYVLLTVSDTGGGMDAVTREHIFEPFFTTKGVGKGTGLGLSMVYGIVKGHQGHIYCYSEPGRGTTFRVYLPAGAQLVETAPPGGQASPLPGGEETVLLVDDEESLRTLGSRTLGSVGYKVLLAASGEEALEIYRRRAKEIDLVIMDLSMPGMGGARCLEEMVIINPFMKVIIASGYAAHDQVRQTMLFGAAAFVAKPFRRAELAAKVRAVLDGALQEGRA